MKNFSIYLPLFLFFTSSLSHGDSNKLSVYAYSSFVSAWGPGPKIIENFKKQCQCEVELTDMGDTNLIIDRLARLKSSQTVDVLVGLDQLILSKAKDKIKWKPIPKSAGLGGTQSLHVGSGEYKEFAAFDWAPLSFVYKKTNLANPPKTLDDLLKEEFKNQILLEDPRLSTPGLQFLAWVYLEKKAKNEDPKKYLQKLKTQIHSVSPSWSTAYGLFKKDQAKLVFSYLSSPVYHWKEEKDENFQSAAFSEPHPVQTEWVGIPQNCKNCELASNFVTYLLSDEAQKILMESNYMFPVNQNLIKGSLYEKLPTVKIIPISQYKKIKVEELIQLWKDVFK